MSKKLLFPLFLLTTIIMIYIFYIISSQGDYEILYTYEPEERELAIEQESKKYKIAVVPKQHNIPYFRAVEKGAIDAAEELEMELIYQGPALADSDLQISTIQEIMDQNVDLIAV